MTPSELVVAIASENPEYDGEIYRRLLELTIGAGVRRFETDTVIRSRTGIPGRVQPFLRRALDEGVRHALIGVDNDGGASRRPEHEDTHRRDEQLLDPNSACSVCWLEQFIPPWWTSERGQQCLVVPVQTIETWLLILRGHTFASAPESTYHRRRVEEMFLRQAVPAERGATQARARGGQQARRARTAARTLELCAVRTASARLALRYSLTTRNALYRCVRQCATARSRTRATSSASYPSAAWSSTQRARRTRSSRNRTRRLTGMPPALT